MMRSGQEPQGPLPYNQQGFNYQANGPVSYNQPGLGYQANGPIPYNQPNLSPEAVRMTAPGYSAQLENEEMGIVSKQGGSSYTGPRYYADTRGSYKECCCLCCLCEITANRGQGCAACCRSVETCCKALAILNCLVETGKCLFACIQYVGACCCMLMECLKVFEICCK